MTEEKFDALLENKEYEAAFNLVDKENTEKLKISLNSNPTSSPFLAKEIKNRPLARIEAFKIFQKFWVKNI